MKKRLYILAPNDRFNYGDLLFPYIIQHYFSKFFDDIKFISTTKSDLSYKGGLRTEAYSELFNVDKKYENHLIIAGGESLCVRWFYILSYVNKKVSYLFKLAYHLKKILGKYSFKLFSEIIDIAYRTKTYYVFSVGKNELPQYKTIAYNALGGSGLLHEKKLDKRTIKILSSVDYFSVRDNDTSIALKRNNIEHFICPDTAILMSAVFPEEILKKRKSNSYNLDTEKYIFFQGNYQIWKDSVGIALQQIQKLQKNTNYKICLCPISTALGHSDQIFLEELATKLENEDIDYIYINEPNIFDIMWLIKHSQMYIGSSLHGAITAMSFSVPFVGYGPRKLEAYINQWTKGNGVHFGKKEDIFSLAMKNIQKKIIPNADYQKKIVLGAFEKLSKLYL